MEVIEGHDAILRLFPTPARFDTAAPCPGLGGGFLPALGKGGAKFDRPELERIVYSH